MDWVVDHLKWVMTATMGFVLYSVGIAQDWWPNPVEIVKTHVAEPAGRRENQVKRPLNTSEIQYVSDGSAAGRLGESLHLRIPPRLNAVSPEFAGLRIRYGLTDLHSTAGADSSVTMKWAMQSGNAAWKDCSQSGLRFSSRRELEQMIAKTLNNSISASEIGGGIICS